MPRRRVRTAATDARRLAFGVLIRVESTAAFADVLLARRLADTPLPPREQALATRLVYGTLAWQGRLDAHLAQLVRDTAVDRLDAPVRAALRLGLYQLLFLDRVPAYAAVDASVRLARAAGAGASGLVNAVLRRAAALGAAGLALPPAAGDPLGRLAVEWSHPRWLVARWADEFGAEALPALLAANNERAPTALRANRTVTTRDALQAELAAEGLSTTEPGMRVLDACAAPGGKTAHVAELLGAEAFVLALDRRPGGLRRVLVETTRLGARPVVAAAGDARHPPLAGSFDAVLVDAPCSGLGTLRRHPELRWRRRPEDIPRFAALQREILAGVAPLVRPHGVLVYAVCTLASEENEQVVAALSAAHPRLVVEDVRDHLPPAAAPLADGKGFFRTLPHLHGLDGFFAARLRARD
ncbi:MAG: 16S rRNA (cytosine(967)-C(5))-methyltransferase RsmB [Deltaproteobacteria bacterium]|nr:MAG: 16S rRNA (cytosine(967)-C(5))-methyltransferase RsmB [Deltaproteobacteria bacterium]